MTGSAGLSGTGEAGSVIMCDPRTDCADPNINRWYCMRGHAIDPIDPAPAPGVCPLKICVNRGANRAAVSTTTEGGKS